MNKPKAVIFDMDGVLINSENLWQQAEKEIFSSLGVQVTNECCALTKTMTTSEVASFWYNLFPWQDKDLTTVEQMVIDRVIELITLEDCVIEGVKEFIILLRDRGFSLALATNSPYHIIPHVLRKTELTDYFDTICSADNVSSGKPDPAIYLETAKQLNISPEHCIVIEDSHSGMLAAKRAGMGVIGFTNGNKELNFELTEHRLHSFISLDANALFS